MKTDPYYLQRCKVSVDIRVPWTSNDTGVSLNGHSMLNSVFTVVMSSVKDLPFEKVA